MYNCNGELWDPTEVLEAGDALRHKLPMAIMCQPYPAAPGHPCHIHVIAIEPSLSLPWHFTLKTPRHAGTRPLSPCLELSGPTNPPSTHGPASDPCLHFKGLNQCHIIRKVQYAKVQLVHSLEKCSAGHVWGDCKLNQA